MFEKEKIMIINRAKQLDCEVVGVVEMTKAEMERMQGGDDVTIVMAQTSYFDTIGGAVINVVLGPVAEAIDLISNGPDGIRAWNKEMDEIDRLMTRGY